MKFSLLFSLLLATLFFSSCAMNYRIISDHEESVDFSNYKTFRVLNHKDGFPAEASPIIKQRIERAIKKEMNGLGYSEDLHADLIVAWLVNVKDIKKVDVYHNVYGEWNMSRVIDETYFKEGTLIVDLIDAKNRQVIWHGKTSDIVDEEMPDLEERINEAMRAMFEKYEKDIAKKENYAVL